MNYDQLDVLQGRIKYTAVLPTTPKSYYGGDDITTDEWRGGEIVFNSGDNRLYIQTATSGTTPAWKRFATQFATSTTSSTTTSSSSTSSSSSSTSSSSTTTMA